MPRIDSPYEVGNAELSDPGAVNGVNSGNLPNSHQNSAIDPLTGEPLASLQNTDFTSGTFLVGNPGKVSIQFLYDGGAYKSEIGIFSLTGMETLIPGSAEFIKEAAKRALSHSEQGYIVISDATEAAKFTGDLGEVNNFNRGEISENQTFSMQPGDKFGIILVPNGTIEEVQENPEITGNKRPLFSLATANPLDAFHVGQIADVTGEGNLFVMEDLRVDVGSDRDYNDLIFSLFGATGTVTVLDELINPNLDWRTTDTAQEIITYVQEQSALFQPTHQSDLEEVSETTNALEPSSEEIAQSDSTLDIDDTDSGVESTSIAEPTKSETIFSDETIVEPTESTSSLEETESKTFLLDETNNEIESTSVSTDTSPSIVGNSDTSNPTESTSVSTETSEPTESSDETYSGTDSDTVEPTESNLETSFSIQSDSDTVEPTESPDESGEQPKSNATESDEDILGESTASSESSNSVVLEETSDSSESSLNPTKITSSDISTETELNLDESTSLHSSESDLVTSTTPSASTEFIIDTPSQSNSSITKSSTIETAPVVLEDGESPSSNNSIAINVVAQTVAPQIEPTFPNFSQGVFLVGETGSINIEYIFDGGYYQSTVGLFNMAGLSEYEWGSPEFFQEIARRSLSNSEEGYVLLDDSTEAAKLDGKLEEYNWNRGIKQGEKTFSLPEGTEFGLILIPDGSLQELFDNPQATGSKKPFLSLTPTDPERALHQTQLVDVTGDGSLFAWEDLRSPGGDTDFNDITFKMSGATGIVTNLYEVIAPDSDWRDSEVGREILNEVQIEPPNSDKEPPIVTAQLFSDNSGNEPFNPVVRGSITDASPIIRLRAGFDETPVEEFVDITAYLQADGSFELDRQTLEQILGNSLAGNSHVLHLISEDAGRLMGVKAIRVGNLVPENDAELNQALAEFYGLDPYPDSLTLVAGTTRQLSLTINELESRPNITATETGTRYFVSHPDLLEVDEDGLVTALDEGEATITMIHGAQMVTIPISIQKPLAGSVTLGEEGGVVEAVDGSLVMIPPGGLEAETAVSLTPLLRESLSLPLPESLDLVGAFSLNLGDEPLTQPAQLAIPAPAGLSAGSEVLFLRKSSLPDETGTWNPTWSIEEAGVVDEKGTIRTTSWPFNGILASGQYAVLTWPSAGLGTLGFVETGISQITASQLTTRTVGGINLAGNLSLATSSFIAHAGWFSVAALTYGQFVATTYLLAYLAKYLQTDLEIIGIPQVGLPVVTTAGVELTAEGIPSVTAVLDTPPPGPADPLAPPVLQQAELTFSNNEPVVVLNGSNFLNDFNDIGSSFEDLAVEFRVGDKSYPGILIPERSVELGDNRYEIAIKVPNIVVLGEAEIVLIRRQKEQMNPLPTDSEIVEKESTPIQLTPTCVELALVAKETADAIGIINAHAPESVIEAGSSSDLLRANIPVGTPDREDKPVELVATNNATRAYVLLQESGRVGLV
ncbi:DUF4114 domain-containing protein, partial [Phormidium sp. CCY1219]|uniref:DUF4114 domain-containing protein n=1 Tax=Phormidium sp. CCY1219 TaxID=2886104 RepID=UPI002D767AB2